MTCTLDPEETSMVLYCLSHVCRTIRRHNWCYILLQQRFLEYPFDSLTNSLGSMTWHVTNRNSPHTVRSRSKLDVNHMNRHA